MQFLRKLAARNEHAEAVAPVVIACLGDSVTHGCFDLLVEPDGSFTPHFMAEQGYAAKLIRRLNALYPAGNVSLLNAGISGDGSAGGLSRVERDALCRKPDLVIVNFALNDAMNPDPDRNIPVYARNMREIFEKILASGAEALLLTPNFMCSYVPYLVQGERLRGVAAQAARVQNEGVLARYVEAARRVAQEMNVPVADAYRRWEQMAGMGVDTTALLSNGINHPTAEMHDIFVEEIMRKVFETE